MSLRDRVDHDRLRRVAGERTSCSIVLSSPRFDRIFFHFAGANDSAELARLFGRAKEAGLTTSLDLSLPQAGSRAARVDWRALLKRVLPAVDLFLPGFEELSMLLSGRAPEAVSGERLRALADWAISSGCAVCVLKLGADGLYVRTSDDPRRIAAAGRAVPGRPGAWGSRELLEPCFVVDAVGTTGAGDVAVAGFLAGLLAGKSAEEATRIAVAAGAASVSTRRAGCPISRRSGNASPRDGNSGDAGYHEGIEEVTAMDFMSTFEGSYAGGFYPKGWDYRKIAAITALGPEDFDVPQAHWHPDFKPQICEDPYGGFETMNARMGYEIFEAVRESQAEGRTLLFILPVGPMGMYRWALYFTRRARLSWHHVHTFNMDEWADGEGNTMRPGTGMSFQEIMERAFFDPLGELTVPGTQRHFATRRELPAYPELIGRLRSQGARLVMVYGVGRSCHVAFWEPQLAEEFPTPEDWKGQTHRLGVQLHPLTIEQQSFISYASRVTSVPLRANTIGPALFLGADFAIGGADGARGPLNWQGQPIWMTLRYGPDPWVPSSFIPTLPGRLFVTAKLGGPLEAQTN